MKIWLHKQLLEKYKEMEYFPITFIVAPWGSGKTTTLKYFMDTYSKNRRLYIDCTIKPQIERIRKAMQTMSQKDNMKYIILDHICDDIGIYIDEFERDSKYNFNLKLILVSDKFFEPLLHEKMNEKILYITYDYYRYELQDIKKWITYNEAVLTDHNLKALSVISNGWKSALLASLHHFEDFEKMQMEQVFYALNNFFLSYNMQDTMSIFSYLSFVKEFKLKHLDELVDNQEMITYLKQMAILNFFVEEVKTEIYCIHTTLKTYMSIYYPLSQTRQKYIHFKLASWFLKHHNVLFAMYHYHMGQNYTQVLELIIRYSDCNYIDDDLTLLYEIYTSIPLECLENEPYCYLKIISDLLTTVDPFRANMMLETFKELLENGKIKNEIGLQGEINIIEGFLNFGDIDRMCYYFKKAHACFQDAKSRIANTNLIITLGSPHILYIFYRKGRSLSDTYKYLQENFHNYLDIAHNNGFGMDILAEAEYYMECGFPNKAKGQALKALHMSTLFHQDSITIATLFLLGRISIFEHDNIMANAYILQLEQSFNCNMLMYEASAALGYLYVIKKDKEKMEQWDKTHCTLFYDPTQYGCFLQGLSYLLKQDYPKASAIGYAMIRKYQEEGVIFAGIYGNLLLCIAHNSKISLGKGMDFFYELLKLCDSDKIIMLFFEFHGYLHPYVREMNKRKKLNGFERQIVALSKKRDYESILVYHLSNKEREVSDFLIHGYSAKEIAERLNISMNTVNFHIKNIYRKLSVKNREEMINLISGRL